MENPQHYNKRKRDESPPVPSSASHDAGGGVDLSLLEAVERSAQNGGVEVLDLRTLKKLVLAFERRLRDNLEARMKYPDQPDKFADSEVELHEEIERLKVLAGAPELYPELVALNTVPSLVDLLGHDNADIAVDVVSLLMDLTDEDVVGDDDDNEEAVRSLVDTLLENNALELLVQNLARLSEADPDEATAIYNTLSTIENLIEVKPAVAELVCERTKLLRWLIGRIKVREFDANKQYASEILAILLQNSPINQKRLGQMNGVDAVLQAVALYKSRDPKSEDEEEMLENLFDCLCCLLMPMENKERFLKSEGVELMIIIMKQKKSAYGSSIRALDFAMTKYPPACERFVDVLGLKTAFAAFMGKASSILLFAHCIHISCTSLSRSQLYLLAKALRNGFTQNYFLIDYVCISPHIPVSKKKKKESYQEELEERLISLIASLFVWDLACIISMECISEVSGGSLSLKICRYSDRVKTETERLDRLQLDDLEVPILSGFNASNTRYRCNC
ncbi:hypothetical protein GW17_00019470 [Ensete ventricosum]|nr:hypothetical protein GW17_00019470 [Ensete ventricosum]